MLKHVDESQPWAPLLRTAFELVDAAESESGFAIPWSLGGGTVLMFRYNHRLSRDIDIFLEDPQHLGFFNPRLHDRLGSFDNSYDASAEAIKLRRPEGDVDFVVAAALTDSPYRTETLLQRKLRVQTSAEIVARKLWHRGDRAMARDLLDLALVAKADRHLAGKIQASIDKNGARFLAQCVERRSALERDFYAIDVIDFRDDYDTCLSTVERLVSS